MYYFAGAIFVIIISILIKDSLIDSAILKRIEKRESPYTINQLKKLRRELSTLTTSDPTEVVRIHSQLAV